MGGDQPFGQRFPLGTKLLPGRKISHSQLMAFCPHDGDQFLLAQATWLMQENAAGIYCRRGSTLPGMPQADLASPGRHPRYNRALCPRLPAAAVPAITGEASLVMPPECLSCQRVLEMLVDGKLVATFG
jgi:hypothetical protein